MTARLKSLHEIERVYEARWTDATRQTYFASHPHRFADPEHQAYPIKDADDVASAAHLVGNGRGDKAKIKAAIIRIARELHLEHALPATWKIQESIQILGRICEAGAIGETGHEVRVTVVKGGKSINGFYYDQHALASIANLVEGARAYADHGRTPADSTTRSVRDMVGFYKDARFVPNDPETSLGRVEATLYIFEAADWLWSMIKEAVEIGKPDLVGVSIDIFGVAEHDAEVSARRVKKVIKLNSCDVVTAASAGGAFQRILHDDIDVEGEENPMSEQINQHGASATSAVVGDPPNQPAEAPPLQTSAPLVQRVTEQLPAVNVASAAQPMPQAVPSIPAASVAPITQPAPMPAVPIAEHEPARSANAAALPPVTPTQNQTAPPQHAREAASLGNETSPQAAAHIIEAERILADLRQERDRMQLERSQLTLDRRLLESILPRAAQENIRERFSGRVFEMSELEREISNMQSMLASMTSAGLIQGHGYEKPGVGQMISEAEKVQAAFDRMFDLDIDTGRLGNIRGFTSIKEAYMRVTGDGQVAGFSDRSTLGTIQVSESAPIGRITEADTTTASFSYLLGTSMNKRLLKDYQAWPAEWQKFCVIAPIKDFKQQSRVRFGAFGSLSTVPEDTAYTSITLQDTAATYVPTKRGNLVTVSRETIINDDLFAIKQIPTKLAVAAAYTLAEFVYGFLSNNSNIFDGNALFTNGAPHSNLGSSALSSAAMQTGVTAMREQTNMAGKRLGLKPAFLIVPPELEFTAMVITKSAGIPGSANNDINPMLGYVTPIVSPQLTNTTQWFMSCDPRVVDTIEVGFVGGQVNPVLFIQDQPLFGLNFTQDVISSK